MAEPTLSPDAAALVADRPQGSGLTPFERYLCDENRALREELAAVVVRPIPEDIDLPGYDVWTALMEDARDRGEVRLQVRHQQWVEIAWEAS